MINTGAEKTGKTRARFFETLRVKVPLLNRPLGGKESGAFFSQIKRGGELPLSKEQKEKIEEFVVCEPIFGSGIEVTDVKFFEPATFRPLVKGEKTCTVICKIQDILTKKPRGEVRLSGRKLLRAIRSREYAKSKDKE